MGVRRRMNDLPPPILAKRGEKKPITTTTKLLYSLRWSGGENHSAVLLPAEGMPLLQTMYVNHSYAGKKGTGSGAASCHLSIRLPLLPLCRPVGVHAGSRVRNPKYVFRLAARCSLSCTCLGVTECNSSGFRVSCFGVPFWQVSRVSSFPHSNIVLTVKWEIDYQGAICDQYFRVALFKLSGYVSARTCE